MTGREKQWKEFSDTLAKHLREYTVPQYGDVGEDEITNYTVEDCVNHILRYAKRYGTQSREGQQELDFLKIAHYAQCAWEKYKNNPNKGGFVMHSYDSKLTDSGLKELNWEYIGESTYSDGKIIYIYKEKL